MIGFTGAFIAERLWPYVLGMAVSLVGLGLMAPTKREIERRQREVTARGSPLSLRDALAGGGSEA